MKTALAVLAVAALVGLSSTLGAATPAGIAQTSAVLSVACMSDGSMIEVHTPLAGAKP